MHRRDMFLAFHRPGRASIGMEMVAARTKEVFGRQLFSEIVCPPLDIMSLAVRFIAIEFYSYVIFGVLKCRLYLLSTSSLGLPQRPNTCNFHMLVTILSKAVVAHAVERLL